MSRGRKSCQSLRERMPMCMTLVDLSFEILGKKNI